jgi:hypothetical protein
MALAGNPVVMAIEPNKPACFKKARLLANDCFIFTSELKGSATGCEPLEQNQLGDNLFRYCAGDISPD